MGALFVDLALFDDEDLVGAADGAEAVGDDEGGAVLHQALEGLLDEFFGGGINAGGGFV